MADEVRDPIPAALWAPKYWPAWLAVGLLRALARLSYPGLLKVGGALGALAFRLPLPQRRVARRNLALCLPELAEAERERILSEHFRSVGITICETALAWWASGERLLALAQIEGLEHVDRAQAEGRGVILLVAHFTMLEVQAGFMAYSRPLWVVYKPSKNALVEEFMQRRRGLIRSTDLGREIINRMIADGSIIAKPGDEDPDAIELMRKLAENVDLEERWLELSDDA